MKVIKTPKAYTSAFQDAVFQITATPSEVIDVTISEMTNTTPIGKKRFTGFTAYSLNVAAYARAQLDVTPLEAYASQFVIVPERVISVYTKINTTNTGVLLHGGQEKYKDFKDLSMGPPSRTITPSQCDEIAFLNDMLATVEITLVGQTSTPPMTIASSIDGEYMHTMVLSMPELAAQVSEGGMGEISDYNQMVLNVCRDGYVIFSRTYTLEADREDDVRICWWNYHGQIDYYTFPRMTHKVLNVEKKRVQTENGTKTIACGTQTISTITSDYINRETLIWLSEIIAAPRVWMVQGEKYTPIEVISNRATLQSDRLTQLELQVTPTTKTAYYNQ